MYAECVNVLCIYKVTHVFQMNWEEILFYLGNNVLLQWCVFTGQLAKCSTVGTLTSLYDRAHTKFAGCMYITAVEQQYFYDIYTGQFH